MTTEERFERIEHLTAGIAEERRKDRDEYKALWRDTQRQLNEMGSKLIQFSEENQEADRRQGERIEQLAEADKRLAARIDELGERIANLVSGFGEFIAKVDERLASQRPQQ
jgi:hypothetical protein